MSLGISVNKDKNGALLAYIAEKNPNIHLRKLLKMVYLIDEKFMELRGFPLTWFNYQKIDNEPLLVKKDSKASIISEKSEKKENHEDKKTKKYIEPEGLLDIEISDKKSRKHKIRKRKNNSSAASSNKKDDKQRDSNKKHREGLKKNISNISSISNLSNNISNLSFEEHKNNSSNINTEKENNQNSSINNKLKEISPKKEDNIFLKLKNEFPMDEGNINDNNLNEEKDQNTNIVSEQKDKETPKKNSNTQKIIPLLNIPEAVSTSQNTNTSFSYRDSGKKAEPGNLGASGKYKKYFKRNLTYSSSYIIYSKKNLSQQEDFKNNHNNLNQISNIRKDVNILSSNLSKRLNLEEINVKLKSIFLKKDGGLYSKRKYFYIWSQNIYNYKLIPSNSDPILPLDETFDFGVNKKNNDNKENNNNFDINNNTDINNNNIDANNNNININNNIDINNNNDINIILVQMIIILIQIII